jgi:ADP-ribose pyrophosphatase
MANSIQKSERIFEGKVFNIRIDELKKSTGETWRVDVVEHGGAVVIIPMQADGTILLVKQYRHPTGKELIEYPAGTLDEGELPGDCAIRECREEVGMEPSHIQSLGGFYVAPGYSTEYLQIYLATALKPAPLPQDIDEDIVVQPMSLEQILAKIRVGEIEDAKTVAGTLFLVQFLGKD